MNCKEHLSLLQSDINKELEKLGKPKIKDFKVLIKYHKCVKYNFLEADLRSIGPNGYNVYSDCVDKQLQSIDIVHDNLGKLQSIITSHANSAKAQFKKEYYDINEIFYYFLPLLIALGVIGSSWAVFAFRWHSESTDGIVLSSSASNYKKDYLDQDNKDGTKMYLRKVSYPNQLILGLETKSPTDIKLRLTYKPGTDKVYEIRDIKTSGNNPATTEFTVSGEVEKVEIVGK